ncbi:phage head morphogenesis protein [Rhizobium etli 8C-3]|uniref:Phage head morphogenesis protein n=1 Tax=Rhizobium etli 8C-3 TaxID=538025 RepID=A0A1L5P7C3_RHIET|nr:phage minor head protein [Rhizobium etli]APO76099.1 phage head morphogenesis protein [Rhizobium etli 8C-3]
MAEFRRGFTAPKEVTGYFDGKTLKPAFSWLDVWGEEHAYAFTVAKATEAEVLSAFHRTIGEAIRSGKGFERWKEDVRAELRKLGWWGPRMVGDPTGEQPDRMVDFSRSRRLKTIFWSNINSARAAGQWERAQRTKKILPYILYVRTTSADPRSEHLAFVGIILPVDDPFWRTHWPPNGWGCKCQVRQISAREAENLLGRAPKDGGIIYRSSPPDLGPDLQHRNRRTGELTMVPPGIDPGWQTNAGLARATTLIENLEERLATTPTATATAILTDLWSDPYLQLAPRLEPKVWLPAGVSDRLAEDLGAKSPVVSITGAAIADRIERHRMSIEDFSFLPEILDQALVMPDRKGSDRGRTLYRMIGKAFWRAFVNVSENGYLRVNSLHQKNRKEVKAEFDRLGKDWPFGE